MYESGVTDLPTIVPALNLLSNAVNWKEYGAMMSWMIVNDVTGPTVSLEECFAHVEFYLVSMIAPLIII